MTDLTFIEDAFGARSCPADVRDMSRPSDEIYGDADAFSGFHWREITCAMLDRHCDAIYGFLPSAFCYYLPGIYCAGIRENRPDLLVNDGLIHNLDRINVAESWDDFFQERWLKLNPQECEATQRWILWLSSFDPPAFEDASLARAYDTMHLLARQAEASPIAGRFHRRQKSGRSTI